MTTDPTDEELNGIWNDALLAAIEEDPADLMRATDLADRALYAAGRESVAPRLTREKLARLLGKYGAEWWEEYDLQHMVSNLIEDTLDRDSIAHEMWTMGAWLDHPKCRNNPKRGNDADYSNGCEPCQKYLLVVADAVLSALGMTEEGQ